MLERRILTRLRLAGAALAFVVAYTIGAGGRPSDPSKRAEPGRVERFFIPPATPIPPAQVARAQRMARAYVDDGAFPGVVLAVGNRGLLQLSTAYGRTAWGRGAPPASTDSTLYDLASLTKVVATTAAVMALVEDRRLDLDAPVRRYVPEFAGRNKDRVTIRQLLTHTGGVRAGAFGIASEDPDAVRRYLFRAALALEPGKEVLYSDIGFVLLWTAAERAAGEPLQRYLKRRVWGPLGMTQTFVGVRRGCARCAPTLQLEGADEPYRGGSYDEVGRRMRGIAGNAGAFSTGRDLARFAMMIANEGRLGNVRVFRPRTVRGFTRAQPGAGTRALGWEVYCREGIVPDHRTCKRVLAFGHTGITGTSLWIDPATGTWMVLLTNRTYLPRWDADMQPIRRRLFRALVIPPDSSAAR
ncbi:MAG TPA: serine hydrolase domain-containing protein [Longimicrobium sp.]|nr:serine hydrolase domain-containing protein [Longimicrobium sp.]